MTSEIRGSQIGELMESLDPNIRRMAKVALDNFMLDYFATEMEESVRLGKDLNEALRTFDEYFFQSNMDLSEEQVHELIFGRPVAAKAHMLAPPHPAGLVVVCGLRDRASGWLKPAAISAMRLLAKMTDSRFWSGSETFNSVLSTVPADLVGSMCFPLHVHAQSSSTLDQELEAIKTHILSGRNASDWEETSRAFEACSDNSVTSSNYQLQTISEGKRAPPPDLPSRGESPNLRGMANRAHQRTVSIVDAKKLGIGYSDPAKALAKLALMQNLEKNLARRPEADDLHKHNILQLVPEERKKKEKLSIWQRLKRFFTGRSSKSDLEKKGILKSPNFFGVRLEKACNGQPIPLLIHLCVARLWPSQAASTQGLFRVSGNMSSIQDMKKAFDYEDAKNIDLQNADVHCVSGIIKMFLRELTVPLFPFDMYSNLVQKEREMDKDGVIAIVRSLPPAHLATWKALGALLTRVASFQDQNLMKPKNLAIVFAPNILRPEVETYESIARDTPICIRVVTWLIENFANHYPEVDVGGDVKLNDVGPMTNNPALVSSGNSSLSLSSLPLPEPSVRSIPPPPPQQRTCPTPPPPMSQSSPGSPPPLPSSRLPPSPSTRLVIPPPGRANTAGPGMTLSPSYSSSTLPKPPPGPVPLFAARASQIVPPPPPSSHRRQPPSDRGVSAVMRNNRLLQDDESRPQPPPMRAKSMLIGHSSASSSSSPPPPSSWNASPPPIPIQQRSPVSPPPLPTSMSSMSSPSSPPSLPSPPSSQQLDPSPSATKPAFLMGAMATPYASGGMPVRPKKPNKDAIRRASMRAKADRLAKSQRKFATLPTLTPPPPPPPHHVEPQSNSFSLPNTSKTGLSALLEQDSSQTSAYAPPPPPPTDSASYEVPAPSTPPFPASPSPPSPPVPPLRSSSFPPPPPTTLSNPPRPPPPM